MIATRYAQMPRRLIDCFEHFDRKLTRHQRFANALEALLPAGWLEDDGPGGRIWTNQDKPSAPPPPPPVLSRVLKVPYMSQLDNGPEGWRQCQTSAIAMVLKFLEWPGITDDRDYLRQVTRWGDTTDASKHAQALETMGVRHKFTRTFSADDAKARIRAGMPVPVGVLHHGPVSAPSGGGHWVVLIGFDDQRGHWVVHDPYGEMDLVNGGWAHVGGNTGQGVLYSYKNFNPRWLHPGPRDGWAWLIG